MSQHITIRAGNMRNKGLACKENGCLTEAKARGFCGSHYMKARRRDELPAIHREPLTQEAKSKVRAESAALSRKRYPDKARARNAVQRAVKAGRLMRPERCEDCGNPGAVEASHDDYSKPLEVEWLCRPCHVGKDYDYRRMTIGLDN